MMYGDARSTTINDVFVVVNDCEAKHRMMKLVQGEMKKWWRENELEFFDVIGSWNSLCHRKAGFGFLSVARSSH